MTAGIPPKRWCTCPTTGQDCRLNHQTSSFRSHFNPWPEGNDLEHGRLPCFLRTQEVTPAGSLVLFLCRNTRPFEMFCSDS
jgi:hypothetical protein